MENFTNTSDIEFSYTIGDLSISVLYVKYPIENEDEGSKPKHFHDYYELILLEEGDAIFEAEDTEVSVTDGEYIIESPQCVHKYHGVERCKAYKFGFAFSKNSKSNEKIYDTLDKVFSKIIWEKIKDNGQILDEIKRLVDSIGKVGEYYRMCGSFTSILFTLYDYFSKKYVLSGVQEYHISGRDAKDIISNALLYYNATDLSIQDVSDRVFLCPRQINRICKKIYGRSFNEQKTFFRLENAKRLLKRTDKKIMDICLETGFSSIGSFYSAFKKAEGMSPKQYRERNIS